MVIQPDSTDAFERGYHMRPFLAVGARERYGGQSATHWFASRPLPVSSACPPQLPQTDALHPARLMARERPNPLHSVKIGHPFRPAETARAARDTSSFNGGASTSGALGKQRAPPLYQMTDCPSQARAPRPNAPEEGHSPVFHIRQPPVNCSRTPPPAVYRLGTTGGKSDRRQSSRVHQTGLPGRSPPPPSTPIKSFALLFLD